MLVSAAGSRLLVALGVCLALAPFWRTVGFAQDRLASVKRLDCTFTMYATGTWNKGEVDAKLLPAKLSIGFESINTDEGSAQVRGEFGRSDIVVRLTQGTLHFVQMFSAGPLYVTTVFPKETKNGKLQAVHTRHEYTEVSLPGFTSRPEQYYGECEAH